MATKQAYGEHRWSRRTIPQDVAGEPANAGVLVGTTIGYRTVNVTKYRSSHWHPGPDCDEWPTREYLLDCDPKDRFADVGDRVEFVKVRERQYNYYGERYVVTTLVVVGHVDL